MYEQCIGIYETTSSVPQQTTWKSTPVWTTTIPTNVGTLAPQVNLNNAQQLHLARFWQSLTQYPQLMAHFNQLLQVLRGGKSDILVHMRVCSHQELHTAGHQQRVILPAKLENKSSMNNSERSWWWPTWWLWSRQCWSAPANWRTHHD